MAAPMPPPYRHQVVSEFAGHLGRGPQNEKAVQKGRWSITIFDIMEVVDRLPEEVRVSLANSARDWALRWGQLVLRIGFSADAAMARIERADREEAINCELQLLAGKG